MPQHSKGEISSVLEQGDFLFNMKGRNSFAVFFLLATLNAAIGGFIHPYLQIFKLRALPLP